MLARLGFYAFVGCDHQQHDIDAADAGEHIAHEALVTGNVDESKAEFFARLGPQFQIGKAEIDGDAAPLLFFKAVGIDAGERLYQRGLAVVDVPCGTDDNGFQTRNSTTVAPAPPSFCGGSVTRAT